MQYAAGGEWGYSDSGQEIAMPIQDLFAIPTKQKKVQEEKALISAVIRYFETAPPKVKSPAGVAEASIINALQRYFVTK
jgi:hypothetical protein